MVDDFWCYMKGGVEIMSCEQYVVTVTMRNEYDISKFYKRVTSENDAISFYDSVVELRKYDDSYIMLEDVYDDNDNHYMRYEIKPVFIKDISLSKDSLENKEKPKVKFL